MFIIIYTYISYQYERTLTSNTFYDIIQKKKYGVRGVRLNKEIE